MLEYIWSIYRVSPNRNVRVSLKDLNRWKDGGWMPFAFSSGRLRERLWEVKIGSHRVFYVIIEKREMVLLHAYKKQGQKLPVKERDIAIRRMKELLS